MLFYNSFQDCCTRQKKTLPFLAKVSRMKPPAQMEQTILQGIRKEKQRALLVPGYRLWRVLQPVAAAALILYMAFLGYRSLGSTPSFKKAMKFNISIDSSLYSHKLKTDDKYGMSLLGRQQIMKASESREGDTKTYGVSDPLKSNREGIEKKIPTPHRK